MAVQAAGAFRRIAIESSDHRVAWERPDQAFFAAGACHLLAWACRDAFPERAVELASVRFADKQQVFHTFATWHGWAFDHCGWNPERELLAVNQAFEGHPLERVRISSDLALFCDQHHHRMPNQYWQDPQQRARDNVDRHIPPWEFV